MYLRKTRIDTDCGVVQSDTPRIIPCMAQDNKKPAWALRAEARMRDLGLKQDDLKAVLSVSTRGAVGHYLSGRRELKLEQMLALKDRLGMSMDALFAGEAPTTGEAVSKQGRELLADWAKLSPPVKAHIRGIMKALLSPVSEDYLRYEADRQAEIAQRTNSKRVRGKS